MGQSVSLAFGLVVLGTLLGTSIIFSVTFSTNEYLETTREQKAERSQKSLNTHIDLLNATLDNSNKSIHLYLKNIGSESISEINKMDVFTNATLSQNTGAYVNETWVPSSTLGSLIISAGCYWTYSILDDNTLNPLFLDPNEVLNITIVFQQNLSQQTYFYRVCTPNAVVDSSIYNTTIGVGY
ncbi:MAG: hypothetical protein ACTSVU_07090 [Promethearchaeota archaeon]